MADAQFTLKTPIKVEEIKENELYGVLLKATGEPDAFDDGNITAELAAAEDFYERELQIRFRPTRVFSDVWGRQNGAFPSQSLLLLPDDYDPINDIDEPAYNYDQDFWDYGRWGELNLNWRPLRDVSQLVFAFPGTMPLYSPPRHWMRLDRKFGKLQLVPSSGQAIMAVFNQFLLSRVSGTRGLPQSIFIDYEVGFTPEELCAHHKDLLKALRLRTILSLGGVLTTIASPKGATSASLGMDGLSRSQSFGGKYGAYSGKIELAKEQEAQIFESWKRREKGVPLAFAG